MRTCDQGRYADSLAWRQPSGVPQQVFIDSALSQRLTEELDCNFLYLIQVRHFHDVHFKFPQLKFAGQTVAIH